MSLSTVVLPADPNCIAFAGDVPVFSDPVTESHLRQAAHKIAQPGAVVAFPTETVYGLGGSALDDASVRAIYAAKNRPADNPLIVHVSSLDQVRRLILTQLRRIPPVYDKLIQKFWPGPLTILLPIEDGSPVLKLVTAGQTTVGVRMPRHTIGRALIALSNTPLAAPSANASTRPSSTLASHVAADLDGRIPLILDGGPCAVGVESTVVDGLCTPPMLLRPGGVSPDDVRRVGGAPWRDLVVAKKTAGILEPVRTPGMKYRHYSPTAKVVLFINCGDGAAAVTRYLRGRTDKTALLRAGRFVSAAEMGLLDILERQMGATAAEIGHNLFKDLRDVDALGVKEILVEGIDEADDGLAVMNRLSKAASETIDGLTLFKTDL